MWFFTPWYFDFLWHWSISTVCFRPNTPCVANSPTFKCKRPKNEVNKQSPFKNCYTFGRIVGNKVRIRVNATSRIVEIEYQWRFYFAVKFQSIKPMASWFVSYNRQLQSWDSINLPADKLRTLLNYLHNQKHYSNSPIRLSINSLLELLLWIAIRTILFDYH